MRVVARAPGRINLIGDHTDYTGGLCFPMAIDAYVEVSGTIDTASASVRLESEVEEGRAEVPLDVAHPGTMEPPWARFVAAVVAEVRPDAGFDGVVTSTLPAGVGLSSSAALEVAVALAVGARSDDPIALGDVVPARRACRAWVCPRESSTNCRRSAVWRVTDYCSTATRSP